MSVTLAERLRSETRAQHVELERSALMQQLLRGRMPQGTYCALLRNLHPIYQALEAGLAACAVHPGVASVCSPLLWREPALRADLDLLHGPDWPRDIAMQSAAAAYARHLSALVAGQPERLVAHAYVRYLGDLSGGQVLARIVSEQLGLRGGVGVRFYDFGRTDEAAALKQRFRAGLEATVTTEADADAVVDEARRAFEMHAELFEQLHAWAPAVAAEVPLS